MSEELSRMLHRSERIAMTAPHLLRAMALGLAAVATASAATPPRADGPVAAADLPLAARQAAEKIVAESGSGVSIAAGIGAKRSIRSDFGTFDESTQIPIASASKWLTAATVMALVDEGKLSLDKPISTWLPEISGEAGKVTLRQLLSQTSGLAGSLAETYDLAQDHRMTLAQSAQEITGRPLAHARSEVFVYGGPGFQVAGAAVERVTGQRWSQVFDEKIGRPLGMQRTYWTHLKLDRSQQPDPAETLNPVLQGGAVSTAEDYMRFLGMLAQGGRFGGRRILSPAAVDMMLSDQTARARMTPTGASALDNAHYALGNWCETWDRAGRCLRSSSIGAFGVYPWVERKSGRYGIVYVYIPKEAFRFWPQIESIRDAVDRMSVPAK
jgi:CubicO group peptidase (beta-lactamase class C family)